MKKLIFLILCVMLVVGVFAVLPTSVSAENHGSIEFYVYVTSPGNGGTVTDVKFFYSKTRNGTLLSSGSAIYEYQWLNEKGEVVAENQSLPADIIAASAGKVFKLKVSVVYCQSEMYLTGHIPINKVDVNAAGSKVYTDYQGNSISKMLDRARYNNSTDAIELTYTFKSVSFPVNYVDIRIPAPAAGEYPELYDPCLTEGTELSKPVVWEDKNDHVSLLANSQFKKGHTYSCEVLLKLKDYYYWADNPIFTINGNNATAVLEYGENDYGEHYKYRVTYKFPPAAAKSYNLWLGDTQVTDDNRGNILGDGKASFDPETNTLTLDKPTITISDGATAAIYSKDIDLTVKGKYTMASALTKNGIYVENGSLTLGGDLTFRGSEFGIYADKDVTIESGNVKGYGGTFEGVDAEGGNLVIKGEIARFEAEGGRYPATGVYIIMAKNLTITEPEDGAVRSLSGFCTIAHSEGYDRVTHVVIRGESETYIRGDVDESGKVNVFDASYILKGTTGTKDYPDYKTMDKDSVEFKRADVDGSGTVNIFDAAIVLKHATGDKSVAKYGVGEEVSE